MMELKQFLLLYGPMALLALGIFEEIFFFIPSSLVFVAAGFFLIPSEFIFTEALAEAVFRVAFWTTTGVVIGSFFIYFLVYWGGKPLVVRWGKYFGLFWPEIERLKRRFDRGYIDETVLVFLRALPVFPISVVTAFCGLIRLDWREFFYTTFWGSLMRISFLSLIGWGVGREYGKYAAALQSAEKYGLFIFLLAVVILFIYFHKRYGGQDTK